MSEPSPTTTPWRDAALDHRRAERAGVEVAEPLVHHRRAVGEVGAEAHPRRVGDAHAGRHARSRSSAGTCRAPCTLSVAPVGAAGQADVVEVGDRDRAEVGPRDVGEQAEDRRRGSACRGAARRCDSRCRRRYTSAADVGAASTSTVSADRADRRPGARRRVRSPPASATSTSSGASCAELAPAEPAEPGVERRAVGGRRSSNPAPHASRAVSRHATPPGAASGTGSRRGSCRRRRAASRGGRCRCRARRSGGMPYSSARR